MHLVYSALNAVVCAVCVAGPGLAADLAVKCDFKGQELGAWISPTMFLGHKAGEKQAVVSDPLILVAHKRPIMARVSADNSNRLTVKWTLEGLQDSRKQYVPRFHYTASYLRKSAELDVRARPSGYDNSFQARGKCVVVKR